ncbi:cupin domain-containing protein [Amycolatopsis magusensis]|uniref:cupin domain-containing protein n=1 Tax=Amycolatopsis magusensis TaxID=882444 RepID=UPI0024A9F7D8|nr:cupin domain-containing protein [Amycolatopsis magusensis]MDI5981591.1 cupin domain-containing protein [Amycolatopsis magusensis]
MEPLISRGDDAERVTLPGGAFHLLADASHTHGVLGANRLTLGVGASGAKKHYHAKSTELFYVLDGELDFLLGDGDTPTRVSRGDLVVIPPGLAHAFGAAPGSTADLLAVLTPGVERFGYFRQLGRIQRGEAEFESLHADQDRYDVHFVTPQRS